MPFTTDDLALRQVDPVRWQLLAPVVYRGNVDTITVPAGFTTDLASVPRIFVWLIPRYGLYSKAAVLHDYVLQQHIVSVSDADGLFRRSMRELGVPFLRRWMMWTAVRLGSHLKGAGTIELAQWLLIAIPSFVFLLFPGLVIIAWLALFWLIELVAYVLLKPFSRKSVNLPDPTLRLPHESVALPPTP